MKAYRLSATLKLGLIVAAILIAVVSLWYTNQLARQLSISEEANMQVWAKTRAYFGQETLSTNPHIGSFHDLEAVLRGGQWGTVPTGWLNALEWARSMPPAYELDFAYQVDSTLTIKVPTILVDSSRQEIKGHLNIDVPTNLTLEAEHTFLLEKLAEMAADRPPISLGANALHDQIYYGESDSIQQLRRLPYMLLGVMGLFILVGYLGFSYVRRSEQSSLWVGMAKETAHQLGTPTSSMMGWVEYLRAMPALTDEQARVVDELEEDVGRLQRVTNRFSNIGSLPKLEPVSLHEAVHRVVDYMGHRLPQASQKVTLQVEIDKDLQVLLNPDLFGWVIENLCKNALDAMQGKDGLIQITAHVEGAQVFVHVRDTGKGMDKPQSRHIFKPGFSTKKRGWGLGLSLSKRIIEDYHRGHLRLLETRLHEGTTFQIELQIASAW